jgi:hypothetical protein
VFEESAAGTRVSFVISHAFGWPIVVNRLAVAESGYLPLCDRFLIPSPIIVIPIPSCHVPERTSRQDPQNQPQRSSACQPSLGTAQEVSPTNRNMEDDLETGLERGPAATLAFYSAAVVSGAFYHRPERFVVSCQVTGRISFRLGWANVE